MTALLYAYGQLSFATQAEHRIHISQQTSKNIKNVEKPIVGDRQDEKVRTHIDRKILSEQTTE